MKRIPAWWIAAGLSVAALTCLFSNTSAVLPDSAGYFAYLPSVFFDRNLQLADSFRRLHMNIPLAVTPTGYAATQWPAGPALLWAPFYAAAWALRGLGADPARLGCDGWYWRWINEGTLAYALLAVLLFLRLARKQGWKPMDIGFAAAASLLGTPAAFYALLVPSTSHGVSMFMNTVVVAATLTVPATDSSAGGKDAVSPWRWGLLGALCGIGAMVRPQNALFFLFPVFDWRERWKRGSLVPQWADDSSMDFRRQKSSLGWLQWRDLAALASGFVAGVTPQMLLNRIYNGGFLDQPSAFNVGWRYFALGKILFSPYHGILFWTPVIFLGLAGLAFAARRGDWAAKGLLAIAIADLFVDGLCVSWWEGHSFGLRQTCGLWIAVAFGLLWWLRALKERGAFARAAGTAAAAACALWTLGLMFSSVQGLELELYVPAGRIFGVERSWLGAAAGFARWLSAAHRPSLWVLLLLSSAAMTGMALAISVWRALETGGSRRLALALFAVIGLLDAGVIAADARKTALAPSAGERPIPSSELPRYFLEQALRNPAR